jgi:hypothetical protein
MRFNLRYYVFWFALHRPYSRYYTFIHVTPPFFAYLRLYLPNYAFIRVYLPFIRVITHFESRYYAFIRITIHFDLRYNAFMCNYAIIRIITH